MATIYSALGSKVTIIEFERPDCTGADAEAVGILHAALERQGVEIRTGTSVDSLKATSAALTLNCSGDAAATEIEVDAVIQSVGRRRQWRVGADRAGIDVNARGEISVDAKCRTAQPHIFAIGDVTGAPMLAHRATHQGKVAAEVASGHAAAMATTLIPSIAYTRPELAWVGITAAQARESGSAYKTTSFPWSASGRNLASGGADGLTKLVYCPDDKRILGATIVGAGAGELLAGMVLAIEMGATLQDVALTIHAHPTLSETTAFAAERALGTLTDL